MHLRGTPRVSPTVNGTLTRATTALDALQRRPLSRFLVVGSIVTAVDFAIFNVILLAADQPTRLYVLGANTVSFGIAANVGYQLHARFTFRVDRRWRSFWTYVVVALVGVTVYNTALYGFLSLIASSTPIALNVAKVGAVIVASLWNFQGYRLLAFRPPAGRRA
ncbi:MAG: GtrA family protein [Dehalococcoidia bacterium]